MSLQHRVLVVMLLLAAAWGCDRARRGHGVTPVIAPDGVRALHVSCGENEARCYTLAGQSCPAGYYIQPTVSGRSGNFLVRCRTYGSYVPTAPAAAPTPAYAPAPAPSPRPAPSAWQPPAAADAGPPPGDGGQWPPPEPRAPAEPWPDDLGY